VADRDKNMLALEVCALDRPPVRLDSMEVTVPGTMGLFVVLPGHAPLLSTIEVGVLETKLANGDQLCFAVNGGFAQVLDNHVLILTQTAEPGHEIDRERADSARERAEERLRKHSEKIDSMRAEAALRRALVRLQAAGKSHGMPQGE
jgi:F-type H+-transporting ATPase subunit epsilon